MLGVPSEVVALQVTISGVQVIDFVGRDGKLYNARPQLRKHEDGESERNRPLDVPAA
jgi:hypothetical protein